MSYLSLSATELHCRIGLSETFVAPAAGEVRVGVACGQPTLKELTPESIEGQVENFVRTFQPYALGLSEALHDVAPLVEQTADAVAIAGPASTSYPVTPDAGDAIHEKVTVPGARFTLIGDCGVAGWVGQPCANARETAAAAQTSSAAKRVFIESTLSGLTKTTDCR